MGLPEGDAWPRRGAIAALVLAAPLVVRLYTANHHLGLVPETRAAGLTAHSLARQGDVRLEHYFPGLPAGFDLGYAYRWRDGRLYGIEPLASALTFAPFFLRYRAVPIPTPPIMNQVAAEVAAVALVALGVWLLGLVSVPRALLVVAIIGFATCYRTIVGAGLWQHTSAMPWLVAGLALWTAAARRPGLYPLAGAALAAATACRPILVPAALAVVVDAGRRAGLRRATTLATAAVVVAVGGLALWANWRLHGSLLGGRVDVVGAAPRTHAVPTYFTFSPAHLAGLLIAPSRGLFVFSPVLLFALPGLAWTLGRDARPPLGAITVAGLVIFLLYGFIATWWGGLVFGPRYMSDLLPFFALWLAVAPLPRRGRLLVLPAFLVAVTWSLWVQHLGVSTYPCGWNTSPARVDTAPERLWDWHDTQIGRCAAVRRRPARRPPGASSSGAYHSAPVRLAW